jgi:hypothetical protein
LLFSERISAWRTSRSIIAAAVASFAEVLAPRGERLVAGHDQAGALVAAGDEHEYQVRGLRVEWDVADLVADQQRVALQAPELVLEAASAPGVGEESDSFGRSAEKDALAGQARANRRGDREVGLASAGRAEEDHVFAGVQEVELPEMLDNLLLDRSLEGESNSSEVFLAGNRAERMRASPPCASRAEVSVESSAWAKRS